MSIAKKDYLICYDISTFVDDETNGVKRLAHLARYLEKVSFRIQNSIFLLPKATNIELQNIITNIKEIIDKNQDDIRIYTIKKTGFKAGIAVDLTQPFIII